MSRRALAKRTLVTLLIAAFIVLAVAIAGLWMEKARQEKAIAAFEKLLGRVGRQTKKPDLPAWLAWAWPASSTVQVLNLQRTQVTDAGLKELEGLTSLLSLDLGGTQVTYPCGLLCRCHQHKEPPEGKAPGQRLLYI